MVSTPIRRTQDAIIWPLFLPSSETGISSLRIRSWHSRCSAPMTMQKPMRTTMIQSMSCLERERERAFETLRSFARRRRGRRSRSEVDCSRGPRRRRRWHRRPPRRRRRWHCRPPHRRRCRRYRRRRRYRASLSMRRRPCRDDWPKMKNFRAGASRLDSPLVNIRGSHSPSAELCGAR